jgi:hypothetical protein
MKDKGWEVKVKNDGYGSPVIDLTHIKTSQELDKVRQKNDSKFSDVETVYMRFGKSPKEGYSFNYMDNEKEKGVSVYEAKIADDGSFRIVNANHLMEATYLQVQERPIYVLSGKEIGRGADGEPVIKVEKETTLNDYLKNRNASASSVKDDNIKQKTESKKPEFAGEIFEKKPLSKYTPERQSQIDKINKEYSDQIAKKEEAIAQTEKA